MTGVVHSYKCELYVLYLLMKSTCYGRNVEKSINAYQRNLGVSGFVNMKDKSKRANNIKIAHFVLNTLMGRYRRTIFIIQGKYAIIKIKKLNRRLYISPIIYKVTLSHDLISNCCQGLQIKQFFFELWLYFTI